MANQATKRTEQCPTMTGMRKNQPFYILWSPRMLSIFRIVVALLFMEHGTQKLFGFPGGTPPVQLMSQSGFGGVLEAGGGLLLLLGLFVRPVSFLLAGEMAVAYFMVHAKMGFYPIINKGELAVLYCFSFLYLMIAGGGVWSLDYLRGKSNATPAKK